jgi:hypothetical protein
LTYIASADASKILKEYRDAIATQIRTPAPNKAELMWKQASLASEIHSRLPFRYLPITREEAEAAIAADEAFLAAHPVKRCRAKMEV